MIVITTIQSIKKISLSYSQLRNNFQQCNKICKLLLKITKLITKQTHKDRDRIQITEIIKEEQLF